MLMHLNIKGMAVIDALAIDFDAALNVITGETGAGKSIIIKALGLMTGAKASAEVVRSGHDSAIVSGSFSLSLGHKVSDLLLSLGIEAAEEGDEFSLILRREVTRMGKSKGWINDTPVTLQALRSVGQLVIDVFGQQDNLRLLDSSQHADFLDLFLPDSENLGAVRQRFAAVSKGVRHLAGQLESYRSKRQALDYLEFRVQELGEFRPDAQEYAELLSRCALATQKSAQQEALARLSSALDGSGAQSDALSHILGQAVRPLEKLAFQPWSQELIVETQALIEGLDRLSYRVSKAVEGVGDSEDELEKIQQRLASYQNFMRKFAVSDVNGLVSAFTKLSEDLNFLTNIRSILVSDLCALQRETEALSFATAALNAERRLASAIVRGRVESELAELAMAGSRFDVELEPLSRQPPILDFKGLGAELEDSWERIAKALSCCSETGGDRIQFLLAANRGDKLLPLQRTASGGELSRVMLALKRALAVGAESCVLVFDEIDTGISGKTADVVGLKLKELAGRFQVLCISHLAQVAAYADAHFRVEKNQDAERSASEIIRLSHAESAQEIARILSGTEITDPSLRNARSLVQRAKKAAAERREGRNFTRF